MPSLELVRWPQLGCFDRLWWAELMCWSQYNVNLVRVWGEEIRALEKPFDHQNFLATQGVGLDTGWQGFKLEQVTSFE